MKASIIFLLIGGLLLSPAIAISGDKFPQPDAQKVWTYITRTSPYQQWGHWPGYDGIYPGKSPHGAYLKLYANDIALKAVHDKKPMPPGAIIVKENYGKDRKTLMAVTPMYRVKGYNPKGGDWFWAKYSPDGKALKAGKPKGCIQCHGVHKSQDWLFTKPK